MGYTHYFRREPKIGQSEFNQIIIDFKKVLPKIIDAGVVLADGHGEGKPKINNSEVWFNGAIKCGHKKDEAITIPWPSKTAGGVANTWREEAKAGSWFAGALLEKRRCNGDCSYETFYFPRKFNPQGDWDKPENGLCFSFCKTAFRPYDLAVIVFLIIAKHRLQEKIKVSSDGEDCHWFDGKLLCQMILGYGLQYEIRNRKLKELLNKEGEENG